MNYLENAKNGPERSDGRNFAEAIALTHTWFGEQGCHNLRMTEILLQKATDEILMSQSRQFMHDLSYGLHNEFVPSRIGAYGSAIILRFLILSTGY